jgi:hypothetical protein
MWFASYKRRPTTLGRPGSTVALPRWAATQFVHLKEIQGTPAPLGSSPPWVWAENSTAATEQVEAEYGKGHVISLHNEEDAERPR